MDETSSFRIMNAEKIKQKPRTSILIIINIILWCILFAIPARYTNWFGLILLFIGLIFTLIFTTIGQVIIHFVLRQKKMRAYIRTLLFFLPSLVLIIIALLAPRPPVPPNQTQNIKSPNGNYILSVPTEENAANHWPEGVWKVTIRNVNNDIEYKDEESTFADRFNAYWVWDNDDRVWLYNSDDQNVYFWEKENGTWAKYRWGHEHTKQISREISPPKALYPDYAKKIQ
jgi:hypothetical protein